MIDLDALRERVRNGNIRFPVPADGVPEASAPEAVDALFHLPLLALAILTAARQRPFQTVALGRTVARLFVARFAALRDTPTILERSVTMRRRAVEALVFLEATGLVTVSNDERREIALTEAGKVKLDRARRAEDERGFFLKQLRGAHDRAVARVGGQ